MARKELLADKVNRVTKANKGYRADKVSKAIRVY